MVQNTDQLEEIRVYWGPDEEYIFEGTRLIRSEKNSPKDAWRGWFVGSAPKGIEPGAEYCLKQIVVNRAEKEYPQKREYYDVVAFRGAHQRKILTRNTHAVEVERELRTTGLQIASRTCYVVEPVYESAREWFQKCWRYPAHERLDLIGQYALGCLELRDPENDLQKRRVDAHRDIKKDNGMIRWIDGKPNITLIDYASIHLEKEADSWVEDESDDGEGTYGGFLSPSNTAPEDLHHTEWKVGDTTDVYALGMMLASMFVLEDGEYINLNSRWFRLVNKEGASMEEKDRDMSKEFLHCWNRFDKNEGEETAWVEKSLWEKNVSFRWEDLPDAMVQRRIRRLFVKATRIDPQRRISLDEFLEEIHEIRDMASSSPKRFPLSLYLFEQTDFDQYGSAYAQAAADAFRQEGTGSRALCVRYHHAISEKSQPHDAISCQELPCRNEQEIFDYADQINRSNGKGPDMTVFAMYSAGRQMEALRWAYEFTGNVYMFCREVPRSDQIKAGTAGVLKVCRMLNENWQKITYIDAYVIREREDDVEEALWYNPIKIQYQERTKRHSHQEKQESTDTNLRPYGQMCVIMPDGSIFWI